MSLFVRNWQGNGDRPALALHCMMGNSQAWAPIAHQLKSDVALFAPDLPGHGESAALGPENDLDYHTAATRQVAELIDRPLDLIGHSIGATIALRIAVAAPEAVRSLTLIEPVLFAAAPIESAKMAQMKQVMELLDKGQDDQAAQQFLVQWGAGIPWQAQSETTRQRISQQIRLVADTNATLVQDRANILREGGLEAIDAPVLLIMGERSPPVIPAIAEALAARMQDVGRASVPDASHMLPLTHPRQTAELISLNLERAA